MFDEADHGMRSLVAVNDTPNTETLIYRVRDIKNREMICQGTVEASADSSVTVCEIPAKDGENRFYLIEWETANGQYKSNHYMTETKDLNPIETLAAISTCGYDLFEGF